MQDKHQVHLHALLQVQLSQMMQHGHQALQYLYAQQMIPAIHELHAMLKVGNEAPEPAALQQASQPMNSQPLSQPGAPTPLPHWQPAPRQPALSPGSCPPPAQEMLRLAQTPPQAVELA